MNTAPDPLPTAPSTISFSMQGFQADAEATAMANAIASYIRSISRYINLECLDGVPDRWGKCQHQCMGARLTRSSRSGTGTLLVMHASMISARFTRSHSQCACLGGRKKLNETVHCIGIRPVGNRPPNLRSSHKASIPKDR